MTNTSLAYEEIIQRFCNWAMEYPEIHGAMVIGSRARTDHPADEWADLDLILLAEDAGRFTSDPSWLQNLGELLLTFTELSPSGNLERRVLFKGGLDVDIVPMQPGSLEDLISTVNQYPERRHELNNFLGRGVCILFDHGGQLTRLVESVCSPLKANISAHLPTAEEFLNVVNDFWYHTLWTAKHLRRGELWWAKGGCDGHLKNLLLTMLMWQAQVNGRDSWFRGRFLEQWADPIAVHELKTAFGHYDSEDVWQALFSTMHIFEQASTETAALLEVTLPISGITATRMLVDQLFAGRD